MASIKSWLGISELTDKKSNLWRSLMAEFIGTMLLNFFGCGAVVTDQLIAVSLAFGLAVAGAVQGIGHISGGHINPAVTIGLLAIGKVPIVRGVLYVVSQCLGAIAGSAVLRALSPIGMENKLGVVFLKDGTTQAQGLGVEFFLALILIIVVCGACDAGKPESKGMAPLIIGLAVTVGHIVGVPRTNAGMNPARSLGSSVVMNHFDDHWVYWVGPIFGGITGALLYIHVIGPARTPESSKTYTSVGEEKELQRLTTKTATYPA